VAEIKKRRLGRTNLMVTELGLGAMDTPQSPQGAETLQLALDMGINFIDTARIYKDSEYLIGSVINARGGKNFYIATKTINRSSDGAQYDVDRSLRLLGVDNIDLYQLDDVSPGDWDKVMGENGALAGLKIARERGLIGYIGISSHNMETLEKAITCGEFDAVMLEYSAFFRETEQLIVLAKERDVGVIAMRPLGGSGRTSAIRGRMKSAGQSAALTPAMLLNYVLSNPGISVAIPGARYPDRIKYNVELVLTYKPFDESQKRECESEAALLF